MFGFNPSKQLAEANKKMDQLENALASGKLAPGPKDKPLPIGKTPNGLEGEFTSANNDLRTALDAAEKHLSHPEFARAKDLAVSLDGQFKAAEATCKRIETAIKGAENHFHAFIAKAQAVIDEQREIMTMTQGGLDAQHRANQVADKATAGMMQQIADEIDIDMTDKLKGKPDPK